MAKLEKKKTRKPRKDNKNKDKRTKERIMLDEGMEIINSHPFFGRLNGLFCIMRGNMAGSKGAAVVEKDRSIWLNDKVSLSPRQWAYVIAHCRLHLAFGHFNADRMPGYEIVGKDGRREWKTDCDTDLWNIACDIYITKFLTDIKLGEPTAPVITDYYRGPLTDEVEIYQYLQANGFPKDCHVFGTGATDGLDMIGLDNPNVYKEGQRDYNMAIFAQALASSVTRAVASSIGMEVSPRSWKSKAELAAEWFVNRYPLLGGLASGFKVIYDYAICSQNEISIAAVDVTSATIYVNPAAGLSEDEMKFVLAHEYLHAGLQHYERCQGRERYLWNVACDFVINGWLKQMHVGEMPERGGLYDPQFENASAEEVYDRIVSDLKAFMKEDTFRGYGKGDMIGDGSIRIDGNGSPAQGAMNLDEFYRSTLQQGLSYHKQTHRGLVPAGLEEEIRALSMPPVPWDVKLARWFDIHFAPIDWKRSYARPSRRQGSTPDIPRPRAVRRDTPERERTFGVVIDTSGSMSAKQIGYALGAVASYAAAKEVPFARVVFCDAAAYDAGYIAPEDIAGRVMVKGRGGTILQPGIDLLKNAKDFPKDGPILIITDGEIEKHLSVGREHAYLLPGGARLPFRAKGEVFYFAET